MEKSGFKLTFINDIFYELINSEREIFIGQNFFFSGVEYQFIKLIRDASYCESKVKEISNIRDPNIVKTFEYTKSFKELPN